MTLTKRSRGIRVTGRDAWVAALLRLAQSGHSEICLQSHHLEAFAYGDVEFVNAVKELILNNRRAQVRVLVNDVEQAASGHRLVELGRTLSSFIQFRQLPESDRDNGEDRLIVDHTSFVERLDPNSFDAIEYSDAPADGRERMEAYERLWARSAPSPALRLLFR